MFISKEDFDDRMSESRNLMNVFSERFVEENNGEDNGDKSNQLKELEKECTVNEADVNRFLSKGEVVNSTVTRHTNQKGKVLGDKNIPEVIRDVITIQSNFSPVTDVARSWGVSPASVSNLKNGIPDRREGHELSGRNTRAREVLNNNVTKIRKVVEKKILKTLELITEEALESQDARSLSVIAKNLSGVVNGIEGKDYAANITNVQTIFYSPEAAALSDYEVIRG